VPIKTGKEKIGKGIQQGEQKDFYEIPKGCYYPHEQDAKGNAKNIYANSGATKRAAEETKE